MVANSIGTSSHRTRAYIVILYSEQLEINVNTIVHRVVKEL